MATFRVTSERITILPHPRADALDIAEVGLYRSVVPKGVYQTGDWAVYIPENAVLPSDLIEELGLTGMLAGRARNRVRPRWIRGEFSQGLVCRPKALAAVDLEAAHVAGHNFADVLRITAWTAPLPVRMSGTRVAAPDLLPWIEIEDLKRYPDMFAPGEHVVATEKIHGTACLFTWSRGRSDVSSKGYGARKQALMYDAENLYWQAIDQYKVAQAAEEISRMMQCDKVGIFGEIYGKGVQDLTYGADAFSGKPGFAVFDIRVEARVMPWWLDPAELADVTSSIATRLPLVPRLFDGPYDREALLALAEGCETVSGTGKHLREGLVIRPAAERRYPRTGGRAIAKVVSTAYLTRAGGTEFG